MTYAGPDPGMIKQWESRVTRWGYQGKGREGILYMMTEANWAYDEALRLITRVARRERRKWALVMSACALLVMFGAGVSYLSLTSAGGGFFYVPISGLVGFIYALVRLLQLRI